MSGLLQRALSAYEQGVITRNFDWQTAPGADGAVLMHSPGAPDVLADAGLEEIVGQPGDTDFLATLPVRELGSGSYGMVYEVEGTGIAVKKHFPDGYVGGYEGQDRRGKTYMKQRSQSMFLRDLAINLALERALEPRDGYSTPRYLGHLMLSDSHGESRQYTIMTKLERREPAEGDEAGQERINYLVRNAYVACVMALRASGRRVWFIDWDFGDERGSNNLIPVQGEDGPELGVIDQRTLFAQPKKMKAAPLICRSMHDPDAPWLAVTDPLRIGEASQAKSLPGLV
jgi:hypothetical protein